MTNDDKRFLDEIYKMDGFVGVYCDDSYGVYDSQIEFIDLCIDARKREKKLTGEIFKTYKEACNYAQNGIAQIHEMDPIFLPKLKRRTNSLEQISAKYLRGGY